MNGYKGIDIDSTCGTIIGERFKKDEYSFVISRCVTNKKEIDTEFESSFKTCFVERIPFGAYATISADTEDKARRECEIILSCVMNKRLRCGVWVDAEWLFNNCSDTETATSIVFFEMEYLSSRTGNTVGLKLSQGQYDNILPHSKVYFPLWISRYGANDGRMNFAPIVSKSNVLNLWQYHSDKKLYGVRDGFSTRGLHTIRGDVSYIDYSIADDEIIRPNDSITLNKDTLWRGYVSPFFLNIRVWAGFEYKELTFSPLAKGTIVYVCDSILDTHGNEWLYVKHKDNYGFVLGEYITKEDEQILDT